MAPLFTDFTYDNLGVPKNPMNPFYHMPYNPDGENWVDTGLGGFLQAAGYDEAVSRGLSGASRRSRPCATWTCGQPRSS